MSTLRVVTVMSPADVIPCPKDHRATEWLIPFLKSGRQDNNFIIEDKEVELECLSCKSSETILIKVIDQDHFKQILKDMANYLKTRP